MRIAIDPGPGDKLSGRSDAAANIKVATLVAAALRLATGDDVEVFVTSRGGPATYEERLEILVKADIAVRIEHGACEVVVGLRKDSSAEAREVAKAMATNIRRQVAPSCALRFDSYRRINRLPNLVVASLPVGADLRLAASAIASALAAHVAAVALA